MRPDFLHSCISRCITLWWNSHCSGLWFCLLLGFLHQWCKLCPPASCLSWSRSRLSRALSLKCVWKLKALLKIFLQETQTIHAKDRCNNGNTVLQCFVYEEGRRFRGIFGCYWFRLKTGLNSILGVYPPSFLCFFSPFFLLKAIKL